MENKNKKVDKYLTELKELSQEEVESPPRNFKPKVHELNSPHVTHKTKVQVSKPVIPEKDANDLEEDEDLYSNMEIEKSYTSKDLILGAINIGSIILLLFLLFRLPQKSSELKSLRVEEVKNDQLILIPPNFSETTKKAEELEALFLDDFGVVKFVSDVEKLKPENTAIKRVTFTSQKAIKDRLGFTALPAIIEITGTWEEIDKALSSVETLPYLFRPINIKTSISKDDPNVIIFNYGGLLYVGEKFTKN